MFPVLINFREIGIGGLSLKPTTCGKKLAQQGDRIRFLGFGFRLLDRTADDLRLGNLP